MKVPNGYALKTYKHYYFIHLDTVVVTDSKPLYKLRLLRRNEVLWYRNQPIPIRQLLNLFIKTMKSVLVADTGHYKFKGD